MAGLFLMAGIGDLQWRRKPHTIDIENVVGGRVCLFVFFSSRVPYNWLRTTCRAAQRRTQPPHSRPVRRFHGFQTTKKRDIGELWGRLDADGWNTATGTLRLEGGNEWLTPSVSDEEDDTEGTLTFFSDRSHWFFASLYIQTNDSCWRGELATGRAGRFGFD